MSIEEKIFGAKVPKWIYVCVLFCLGFYALGEFVNRWFGVVAIVLNVLLILVGLMAWKKN